jgi:hypothetical protein
MPLDMTTKTSAHEAKKPIFLCPYCKNPVREGQRLSYPAAVVGAFATVYRCSCGRHIGAPVGRAE